jgi:hypothetical protein
MTFLPLHNRSHVTTNAKAPTLKELVHCAYGLLICRLLDVFFSKMSSNLIPYNFTITNQSPLFQYSPFRDGPISNGWNVSYAAGKIPGSLTRVGAGVSHLNSFVNSTLNFTIWNVQPSSHSTTFVGASAELSWTGTAIYLYGEGSQNGYTIELDGTVTTQTPGVLNDPGLLFSQSGLTYGPHSLILKVVQSGVTISNAIITVGMGQVG